MLKKTITVLLAGLLLSPGLCWAQQNRGRMNAKSLPRVGSELPIVHVVDEQGNPFSTESLFSKKPEKGDYTVLVFGCLT